MTKYRVQVETATTVLHYVTVEAGDPDEARRLGGELVDEILEEEETDPEGSDYNEGGIGGWTKTLDVGEIDGGGAVAWHGFRCMDCGADTGSAGLNEYPLMLRNEVWRSIVPDGEGMLCRADMERRLGRPLTSEDLLSLEKE